MALTGAEKDDGMPWLPTIGTAVHAWLADVFDDIPGYLVEHRVHIADLDDSPPVAVHGTVDLYDPYEQRVVDWKIVGPGTLRSVQANGPSEQYRRQVHLYGRGLAAAGHPVRDVAIAYLPRNSPRLSDAHFHVEPYDPAVADQTIERANRLIRVFNALSDGPHGDPSAWIASLPRDPSCFDCARYPDAPKPALDTIETLLA
jgi:hypothetical protein